METQTLAFPQPLTERYRPHTIDSFLGLREPKRIAHSIVARPIANAAYLFAGPSGVGKTTMGLAIAQALNAQVHHLAARQACKDAIERLWDSVHYSNWTGSNQHVALCDEFDFVRLDLQQMFLSMLDATATLPNTLFGDWTPSPPMVTWIFTTNQEANKLQTDSRFEPRFLSRVRIVPFSSYAMSKEVADYLAMIWKRETNGSGNPSPDFLRIAKEARNNIRACLNALEIEMTLRLQGGE